MPEENVGAVNGEYKTIGRVKPETVTPQYIVVRFDQEPYGKRLSMTR